MFGVFFFFCVCVFKAPKHTHPANNHTHRTSTQHTHKKHRPSLWVGITIRYRRPLRCRTLDCPGLLEHVFSDLDPTQWPTVRKGEGLK